MKTLTEKEIKALKDITDMITISAIKKAGAGSNHTYIAKDGKKKQREIPPLDSALAIINSGYTDTIIDDLKQTVFESVWMCLINGTCQLVPDIARPYALLFEDMENVHDKSNIYIKEVYTTVRKYLNAQKQIKGNKWLCVPLQSIEPNNNDIDSEESISIKSDEYRALTYENLNTEEMLALNSYLATFKRVLKDRDYQVMSLLVKGYKWDEIANTIGCTHDNVKYSVRRIRQQYRIHQCNIEQRQKDGTYKAIG